MAIIPFRLPDLGEGLTEGHILRWLVSPGQSVELNQLIVEIETAKAAVEVPSPYAGVVRELLHKQGDTVDVGTPIISFDTQSGEGPSDPVDREAESGASSNGRTAVLVGYGPRTEGAVTRRRRKGSLSREGNPPATPEQASPLVPVPSATPPPLPAAAMSVASAPTAPRALAKPPVRKLARDLGVNLVQVIPTGGGGIVTRDDVLQAADRGAPGISHAAAGREQRIPVTGVRKLTADAMVRSAFTVPHAAVFVTVDVTATMDLVAQLKRLPEFADVKVGPLLITAKAVLFALARNPELNAHFDGD
ncbi:MAG: biotin/lipoyl-containing protein, partial [Pseudonocardiaceae bacterium]